MSLYVNIPPTSSSNVLDYNGWIATNESFMAGLIPQLTKFSYIKVGQNPMGGVTPATNDGAVEGGGRSGAAGTATFFGASIFQTCNTGKWAWTARAKVAAPTVGKVAVVGISNGTSSHDLYVGTDNSLSATNYIMELDGTTTTTDDTGVARTAALRDFTMVGDAANVRLYIDRVLAVTRAIGTNVVDEPTYPWLFNTTVGDIVVTDFLYGYIAP